ncbi:aldose 1-epimerase [Microbacterium sp.]|uniref:aldose 1-epimerase n=1 Tax=Microbacterium sp. TaxID=51671 RepID=UPI003F94CFCF
MIELHDGAARALIRPDFGGRVVSLEFDGREHLADGGRIEADPWRGGSYPLAPWAGTLARESVDIEDDRISVPRCPDGTLKHGYVNRKAWSVIALTQSRVELRCDVVDAGPWNGACLQTIELAPDRLRIEVEYRAVGTVPVALGLHPWFCRDDGGGLPRLIFTSERRIITNDRGIEVETPRAARVPRDDMYRADGGAPCIEWRDGRRLEVRSDAHVWVVYERDPLGMCVEPWSHTPAEFTSGRALAVGGSPVRLTMELVRTAD